MFPRILLAVSVSLFAGTAYADISVRVEPYSQGYLSTLEPYHSYRVIVEVSNGDDWVSACMDLVACCDCVFYQDAMNDGNPPNPNLFMVFPDSEYTSFYTSPACWPNTVYQPGCPITFTAGPVESPAELHACWEDAISTGDGEFVIAQFTLLCPEPCVEGLICVYASSGAEHCLEVDIGECQFDDCNSNGIDDADDRANCDGSPWCSDCNTNGVLDECDIDNGAADCYPDGIPDSCQLADGSSVDCNTDGLLDECEPGVSVPPVITEPPSPAHQEVCAGDSATFTVQATGTYAPSYKWRFEGVPIVGANGTSYTIDYVKPTHEGTYEVLVYSPCGSVLSDTVAVTVNTPPIIVQVPTDQAAAIGGAASFTVDAAGSALMSFRWRKGAVPLADDDRFSGTISPTLTLDPVMSPADAAAYDVVLTNACGSVISSPGMLTVGPGAAPEGGPPHVINTYQLTGDANDTPWSWRVDFDDASLDDAVDLHVPGVAEGGAIAVAEAFAESINTFAADNGYVVDQLAAQAESVFGGVILGIRSGDHVPFDLWVGAADVDPDCQVVPQQLPACGFNPTIEAAPGRADSRGGRTEASSGRGSVEPSVGGDGYDPAFGRAATYDCLTGRVTYAKSAPSSTSVHGRSVPGSPGIGADGGVEPSGLRHFVDLAPIGDPGQYPWSANCKVLYYQDGEWREGSGTLIDPLHVITSGGVVHGGPDGDWTTAAVVMPAYDSGVDQWFGAANVTHLHTWTGWLAFGWTSMNLGVLDLDRPVGVLTGTFGYGYNQRRSFYRNNDLHNCSYPAESPYDGCCQYYWGGDLDDQDYWELQVWDSCFQGMEGGGLWVLDGNDNRHVYGALASVGSAAGFTKITKAKFEDIEAIIAADKPYYADVVLLRAAANPDTIYPGGTFNHVNFYIHNYSQSPVPAGTTLPFLIYLSTDSTISPNDIQIGAFELSLANAFNPMSWQVVDATPTSIPSDTPAGSYYIGVILNWSDAQFANNYTSGWDAMPITVLCPPIASPDYAYASQGDYADRLEISWGSVSGADKYEIWKNSEDDQTTAVRIESAVTDTHYGDVVATPGVDYWYWVTAARDCGEVSDWDAQCAGWRGLAPPASFSATDGAYQSKVRISWNTVNGASHYQVYRSETPDYTTAPAVSGWVTGTSFDDTTATPGILYYYWGRAAVDASGTRAGNYSSSDPGSRGTLDAPANVSATKGLSADFVRVTWYSVPSASHYGVYRGQGHDPYAAELLISTWITDTTYDDTTAVYGEVYNYWVRAATGDDGSGAGGYSEPDEGYLRLAEPTGVSASDDEFTDFILVTWDAVSGAAYYVVFRHTSDDYTGATILNWGEPDPDYHDLTAVTGDTYYYWIRAVDGTGYSSWYSESDSGRRAFDCNDNDVPDPVDPDAVPPVVNQDPANQIACATGAVTFTADVTAVSPSTYRWRQNGATVAEGPEPDYVIGWVDPTDAGSYDLVVYNGCGSDTSGSATLTVDDPPSITLLPVDQAADLGGTAGFTSDAVGTGPLSYQWRKSAIALTDDGRISGSATAALTIDALEAGDMAAYDVVVTGPCGPVISQPAWLTVNLDPCPPAGADYFVNTYEISEDPVNVPWSWRIESTGSIFMDTPDINVAGLAAGTALDVAQAIADSINAYATTNGCGPDSLLAGAGEFAGTVVVSIRTGGDAHFVLYVGPEDGPADCKVECGLPWCEFDSVIEQLALPRRDCNANGWDDFIDITVGASIDCDVNGVPDECEALATALGAVSVLDHGGTDLPLDLATSNIEPRIDGVLKLEVEASQSVSEACAMVSCLDHDYTGAVATSVSDTTVTVEFSPALPDEDCCTVTLGGDVSGSVAVRTLRGDVEQDGTTSTADAARIKLHFGLVADETNAQFDIDASGRISMADFFRAKLFFGNTAPECP